MSQKQFTHFCRINVAKTIYALCPEIFCAWNSANRKKLTFCVSVWHIHTHLAMFPKIGFSRSSPLFNFQSVVMRNCASNLATCVQLAPGGSLAFRNLSHGCLQCTKLCSSQRMQCRMMFSGQARRVPGCCQEKIFQAFASHAVIETDLLLVSHVCVLQMCKHVPDAMCRWHQH